MFHELRTYRCAPGRLRDVIGRMDEVVVPLWGEHGIHAVGFWTVDVGSSNNDLIYLSRWESAADREAKWDNFNSDPRWVEARARTEADGPLLLSANNDFLEPTAFSVLQ